MTTDTQPMAPTDAELDELRQANSGRLNFVTFREFRVIARAVLAKWGAQPVEREPLTREQVKAICVESGYETATLQERADFINGIRHAERHHGIKKGGQHGAE